MSKASKTGLPPEGGAFKCGIHDFETTDPLDWEAHLLEKPHYLEGTTQCADCGTGIKYKNVRYRGAGKPLNLVCGSCKKEREKGAKKEEVVNDK